jgi:DNA invertase Pin-like site-specific DNA recombinase
MRKKCPILVASLDRVSRNTAAIESFMTKTPVKIVVANLDAEANEIIIRSEVKKAQVIAEHISETTRASLQALKKSGVKLGNKTN